MINYVRYALYTALVLVSFLLWNAWIKEHPSVAPPTQAVSQTTGAPSVTITPGHQSSQVIHLTNQTSRAIAGDNIVNVKTDNLLVQINLNGGNIIGAALLKYPEKLKNPDPVVLLNKNPDTLYVTQSGLTETDTIPNEQQLTTYRASQSNFVLAPNQKEMVVTLTGRRGNLNIVRKFTFKPNSYQVQLDQTITNISGQSWSGNYYMQILRNGSAETGHHLLSLSTFSGIAIYSPENRYEQFKVSKLQNEPLNRIIQGGWIAFPEHYFLSAWIPNANDTYHYYSEVTADHIYVAGMIGHQMTIAPNQSTTLNSTLYLGPKVATLLDQAAPFLSHTIDYGWLWFISILLFKALKFINSFIGNWGWSIVIITVLIKLLFYKLSATSYVSMANMRTLQPKIQQLREQHGNDKQAVSRATMELYRKEKINPLGGCLPILVQIPVFIALYYMLLASVELRQAPFILWIHDLSVKDPYYILPLLMGASMFIQQKLSPAPPDPAQAKMMMFLPLFMTVLFINFPAGLVLYWLTNNALSILQQWYITHKFNKGGYQKKQQKHKK